MALRDFANVVLSTSGPALSQVGFGTIAIACCSVPFTVDWSRSYSNLSDLVTDGFTTYSPGYKSAQAAFSQDPRPNMVKILRCPTPWTFTCKFTPYAATNLATYAFVVTYKGVPYTVSFTADGTATVAEIVTGLAAAFAALPAAISADFTASGASSTDCIITAGAAARICYLSDWTDNLKFENTTPDPGLAADLANIRNHDSDWYGLALDNESKPLILAADGWAETQDIMGASAVNDTAVVENTAANVALTLKAQSAGRWTLAQYKKDTGGYGGAGLLGERFPYDPGSDGAGGTWHGKTVKGQIAGTWSPPRKRATYARPTSCTTKSLPAYPRCWTARCAAVSSLTWCASWIGTAFGLKKPLRRPSSARKRSLSRIAASA
jgi:hypothetical protein